jgi:uncharacterized protein YciI
MDAFAGSMVARGPTLGPDRETPTGSLHVVGLPSADAARDFVAREPNNRAGVYAEHLVCGFENLLGRTMWEFSTKADEPMFLLIALAEESRHRAFESLPAALRERLILDGTLTTLDAGPGGVALIVQARDRGAARALAADALDDVSDLEVHDWEFGGRR